MKHPKILAATTALALILGSAMAHAGMANGTYTYSSSGSTIWDISGDYSNSLDGLSLEYSISQDGSGNFEGTGSFSYDEYDISGDITVSGKVTGSAADPSVSMEMLMSGSGTIDSQDVDFTATARIQLAMDAAEGELVSRSGSVSVTVTDLTNGRKGSRSEPLGKDETFPLPSDSTGDWNLTLDLTPNGTKYSGTATIQTSTGGTMEFTATGTYSSRTDTSNIKLKGDGGELTLVISTSGQSLSINSMKGKVYGQSVRTKTP